MAGATWNCCRFSAFCVHHTTMHPVTCHLHFWQSDLDLLCATAITLRWNGYRNKSNHRKLNMKKKMNSPAVPAGIRRGFEPATCGWRKARLCKPDRAWSLLSCYSCRPSQAVATSSSSMDWSALKEATANECWTSLATSSNSLWFTLPPTPIVMMSTPICFSREACTSQTRASVRCRRRRRCRRTGCHRFQHHVVVITVVIAVWDTHTFISSSPG